MSADNAIQIIADAFYTILTEASLHQVAPILASISTMLADNTDKYDVADMINKHVGQAEDQQTRQLLADLRMHFEQRIYKDEIMRLQECFTQDRESGWNEWLLTFTQVICDWRAPLLLKMLPETAFTFPEQKTEDVERIRQWARYWLIEYFEECCGMMLYFAQQTVLPPAQRAKLLVFAAEIQLYRFACFTQGKRLLEEAEAQDPQAYSVKRGWGIYWLLQKEYKRAQNFLQEAISLQPQTVGAYIEMGDFYDVQDDFEAAEEWYHEAIRRDAGDPDAYIRLLRLYGRNEELFKLHEVDFPLLRERAGAVYPFASYRAYLTTAFVYQTNKRFEDAYSWYKQTIALDETRVEAYIQLSYAYTEEKKYQEAYDVLQDALRVAPELFDAYWAMATLYEQQEHWAEAVEWYTRALSYRLEWEGILHRKIGEMRWQLQEYAEAEDELFKALNAETEEDGIQGIIYTLEVYAKEYYETLGKPDAARKIYQEIYRVRGTLYEASYSNRLGNLAYSAKNYQEAAACYRKAVVADPKDPDYPSNLAYALEHLISPDGGIQALDDTHKALQDALKLSPKNSEYAQRRERIELKQRLVKKSGTFILGLSPAAFSIKIELGSALVQPFLEINGMPPGLQALVDALRQRFLEYYGIWIPNINFSDSLDLSSGDYTFNISGLPLIRGEVPVGKRFFPGSSHDLIALAIQVYEEANDPLTGMKGCWLAQEDWQRVEATDLPLYQEMEYPLRHLEAVLLGINVTLIDHPRTAALLVKEPSEGKKQIAGTPEKLRWFVQVVRTLASERIPFAPAINQLAQAFLERYEIETDLTVIIEQLRQLPILQSTLPGNNTHYDLYRLEEHFEQDLTQSLMHVGASSILVMESAHYEHFLNEVTSHITVQQQAALLVTDARLRPFLRVLLDPQLPHMPTLALNDLLPDLKQRAITEIEVSRKNQENGVTRDGRFPNADDLLKQFALSLQNQHNGIESKSVEEDYIDEDLIEIKIFLHPSWHTPVALQKENSPDSAHLEVQIAQKISEKMTTLQYEVFQGRGIILPAIGFEFDENLKFSEIRVHVGTQQKRYNETFSNEEWATQTPEELVAEIGILQLVEDIFSIIPSWCREMGGILLSMDDVQLNLQILKDDYYYLLVESALQQFSLPKLTQILKEILNRGESIRDLRTILEVLVAIIGTIPIDDRHFPVYPGLTTKDMLKDEKILLFLPRAAKYCPTYEGKILKQLNAADYAHYVQTFLLQTPFLKKPDATAHEDFVAQRETALDPAKRLSEKISEAFHRSRESRIIQRAIKHQELKAYQEALADYTQAITLNPVNANSFNQRGNLHCSCDEYQEALVDYTQAIMLNPANAIFYFNRAITYGELKAHEEALADYTQAITLNPTEADYFNQRGKMYFEFERYREALNDLSQAIILDPSEANNYVWRAYIYRRFEEYDKALIDYTQIVTLMPTNANSYYNRAAVYEELKAYQEALADYTQAITLDPENTNYYIRRGNLHYTCNEYQEALADYTQAITLNPANATFYFNRATAYEELKAYEEALADYTQAITLNPTQADYYNRRGIFCYQYKEYQKALEDFNQAIELLPDNAVFYFNRATACEELKAYEEALADYTQAITLSSTETGYYNRRARLYSALKEYGRALADYTEMITLNPSNPAFFTSRSYTHFMLEEYEETLADLEQVLVLDPDNPVFYFNKAVVYERLKEYDKALVTYTKAITLDQSDADYYYRRGECYAHLKEYDKALTDYTQAVTLAPSNANFYYKRAGVLETLNKYEDALNDLERAISLSPSDVDYSRERERVYGKYKKEMVE